MKTDIEVDIMKERLSQLEDAALSLSADIQHLHMQMQDVQNMIVKIATNQQQIAERVSMWPYVKVESKRKRTPPKEEDSN